MRRSAIQKKVGFQYLHVRRAYCSRAYAVILCKTSTNASMMTGYFLFLLSID